MTYPPDFTYPESKLATAEMAATVIATLAPGRRSVVQAGGCAGLWPLALAKSFAKVYTFEPDPTNFRYLRANVAAAQNVTALNVAVGETHRTVGMTRPKPKAGLWRVDGDGDTLMVPLDDVLSDEPIDAIVLDVEGYEVQALHGAAQIIAANRPLLWCEFLRNTAEIEAALAAFGYHPPIRGIGGDCYSIHASRMH